MAEDLYVCDARRWCRLVVLVGGYVQCGDRSVTDVNFVNENE
jgi:hypothetical protein